MVLRCVSSMPKLNEANHAVCSVRRQIALFHEYRTRLIADVVTGKLDVREVATELPEDDLPGDAEEPTEEYPLEVEVVV